jgi:hypothetical protein
MWANIPEYHGLYQINEFSVVRSLNFRNTGKTKEMKPNLSNNMYYTLGLTKDSIHTTILLHRLMASAFLGLPIESKDFIVDHIDNNKLNNNLDNLQLTTYRYNNTKDQKKKIDSNYTGVKKVKRIKSHDKWAAHIHYKKRLIHLGTYDLEILAANAYNKANLEIKQDLDLNLIYKIKNKKK